MIYQTTLSKRASIISFNPFGAETNFFSLCFLQTAIPTQSQVFAQVSKSCMMYPFLAFSFLFHVMHYFKIESLLVDIIDC